MSAYSETTAASPTPARQDARAAGRPPEDGLLDAEEAFSSRPLWLEKWGVSALGAWVTCMRALPPGWGQALGRNAGRAAYYLWGPDFMDVRRHLRIAFRNELGDRRRRELARAFWMHFGQALAEAMHLVSWTRANAAEHMDLSEMAKLEPLRASGRGAIVAAGHLGLWEAGPYAFALLGYPIKLLHNPGTVAPFFDFVNRERERSGMEVISKHVHPWRLRKLLGQGAWICMVADVNNTRRGDQVPFFGTLASSYLSHAALQQVTGCPIVVCSTARQPDGRHKLHVWRILEHDPSRTGRVAQRRVTLEIHKALEEGIRAYPEQWFWHYRRWRSRPVNESGPGPDGLPPLADGDWWATIDWDEYLKSKTIVPLPS
ncbi:MAG: lysophospholipid acyltransferase family protein [Planctomycetes bacterium]|nr:lysophospholipid acyltransferase family protein [Planctomycetota bacterium]